MSADLDWGSSLTDLMRDVAALPQAVKVALKPKVVQRAQNIVSRTQAEYGARGVESVGKGMRVEPGGEDTDLSARVKNPSPLAHIYEFGSAVRSVATDKKERVQIKGRWVTLTGRTRGRMPAANVFVPIVEQERAGLVGELTEVVASTKVGPSLTVR